MNGPNGLKFGMHPRSGLIGPRPIEAIVESRSRIRGMDHKLMIIYLWDEIQNRIIRASNLANWLMHTKF